MNKFPQVIPDNVDLLRTITPQRMQSWDAASGGAVEAENVELNASQSHFEATDVDGALSELFTSVSSSQTSLASGLAACAGSIEAKGGVVVAEPTISDINDGIQSIPGGEGGLPPAIIDMQAYLIASGTSLTGTVTAKAGTLIIAAVLYRQPPFIMPEGWIKLSTAPAEIADTGAYTQYCELWYTFSTSTFVTLTIQQNTAARMHLTLACLDTTNIPSDVPTLSLQNTAVGTTSISYTKPCDTVVLLAAACIYWVTTTPHIVLTCEPYIYKRKEVDTSQAGRLTILIDDETPIPRTLNVSNMSDRPISICACSIP